MSFNPTDVGIERGATQLLLDREPRVLNRWGEGGPVRADAMSLPGTAISVEYHQVQDRRELVLALEKMTETQTTTLRSLLDGTGPITVKIDSGSSSTISCSFTNDWKIEPIIGAYTESAPAQIRYHRAELRLLRLT